MNNINYREDQLPIISYENGTMAVPAVPGAGKTFIVTNLVAKLLCENKHKGGKILILTYMNSAVSNFKGRIKKILQDNEIKEENSYEVMTIHSLAVKIIKEKPEIVMLNDEFNIADDLQKNIQDNEIKEENSYEVMTIHSLAVKIIKEKPEIVMLNDEFNIADDLQKNIILNECINNFKLNGGQRAFVWFLKDQKDNEWKDRMLDAWENGFYDLVGNAIGELKYNDISPFDLERMIDSDYKGILKIILPIYKEYDRKLKQHGLLDYDDILILAHKALTLDEGLRNKFQSRYKYIFEDECQDSNEIQGKIIKLISKENNNLVRVGDINQSITGTFSSSDPKYFKEFIREADNCYRMDMSNRSSKDIIDLANRLVKYVTKEFNQIECREALEAMDIKTVPENMGYKENPKPDVYSINTKRYITWKDEVEKTVIYAKNIKKKYPDKSIGILVPYNEQITQVARVKTVIYAKNIKKKYPDKSIGILVPYNEQITQVARVLIDNNLEFEELGPNSLNKRRMLVNISYIIDFILNCDDIEKLVLDLDKVFIHTDNELGKSDFLELIKGYTTEELIYNENNKDLIIDTNSDVYKGYIKGINAIKEIFRINKRLYYRRTYI